MLLFHLRALPPPLPLPLPLPLLFNAPFLSLLRLLRLLFLFPLLLILLLFFLSLVAFLLSLSLSRSVSLRLLFFLLRLYTLLVVSSVPSASSLQTRRQSKLKARLGCEWGQHPERVSIPGRNNRDCAYQASIIPPSPDFNVGARATMHWGKKDS